MSVLDPLTGKLGGIMIFESISAMGSIVSMAKTFKEAFCHNGSDLPPLVFEYTYQEPFMFLRIENVSNHIVQNIRIKRDFSDTVKPYFDNENSDRFDGISFDLYPGESKRDTIGLFPLCMDYPQPNTKITIDVLYGCEGKEKKFRREIHLTL